MMMIQVSLVREKEVWWNDNDTSNDSYYLDTVGKNIDKHKSVIGKIMKLYLE